MTSDYKLNKAVFMANKQTNDESSWKFTSDREFPQVRIVWKTIRNQQPHYSVSLIYSSIVKGPVLSKRKATQKPNSFPLDQLPNPRLKSSRNRIKRHTIHQSASAQEATYRAKLGPRQKKVHTSPAARKKPAEPRKPSHRAGKHLSAGHRFFSPARGAAASYSWLWLSGARAKKKNSPFRGDSCAVQCLYLRG